jgi:hypothetical protein
MKTILFFVLFCITLQASYLNEIQNTYYSKTKKIKVYDIFEYWENCDDTKWYERDNSVIFECYEDIPSDYALFISNKFEQGFDDSKQHNNNFKQKKLDKQKKRIVKLQAKYQRIKNRIEHNNQQIQSDISELDKKDYKDQNEGLEYELISIQEEIEQKEKIIAKYNKEIQKTSSSKNDVFETVNVVKIHHTFDLQLYENRTLKIKSMIMSIKWADGKELEYFNEHNFFNIVYNNKIMFYRDVATKKKAKSAYRFFKRMRKQIKE